MSDIAIKLENVSKYYKLYDSPKERLKEALHPFGRKYHKQFYALRDINLEIKKGEILGVVGRNGSGKSTLLKIISRVLQPSSGQAVVNGAVSALLELNSGLNPDFTGMQNIRFSGTMQGFSPKEMDEKIDEIISFADIGEFINQPLKTYSSGMKARLGFAIAVNMEPEILVLDEVLSVGDELFKRKCYAKMEEFFNSGCTVLFVSHSIASINEVCTRVVFIDKGIQLLEGPPKFVTTYYQQYIYAKPQTQAKIKEEILQLNKNDEKKKVFESSDSIGENIKIEEEGQNNQSPRSLLKEEVEREEPGETVSDGTLEDNDHQEPFYIPDFEPKSTVDTKYYDVEIFDVMIKTLGGKKVNALVMGQEYFYSYKVKFNVCVSKLLFNVLFRTPRGVHVGGDSFPQQRKQYFEKVEKGDLITVDWNFKCILLPGTYYTSISLSAFKKNGKERLASKQDALVFKVQNIKHARKWGIVNLLGEAEVKKTNNGG